VTARKQPQTESALVPVSEGDERRNALIRAVGFDKLSEPQRELALAIAQRYDLDPMLKHLVMVEGRPYITRDGLLHVAHRSNDFDGIEVTDPILDAEPDAKGRRYYRVRCSVYRKSFSRPFVYPGRYPAEGKNAAYNEEMAIKVGEVMSLRRAFDVSAPVLEERWSSDHEDLPDAEPEPTSLAERVALKAAAIVEPILAEPMEPETSAALPVEGLTESGDEDEDETIVAPAEPEPERPAPAPEPQPRGKPSYGLDKPPSVGGFKAPSVGVGHQPLTPDEEPASPAAIAAFGLWATGRDPDLIRGTARTMFPNVRQFNDLTVRQLGDLTAAIENAERAVVTDEEGLGDQLTDEERTLVDNATETVAIPPMPFHEPETAGPTNDAGTPVCGAVSPLSDATCTMDPGHKGAHRAGLKEAW
jgi:hypothetical protein